MALVESQENGVLGDDIYDDPSQLSQLLRQRAGSELAVHFTDSTARHHCVNTAEGQASSKSPQRGAPQHAPAAASHPPREAQSRRVRIDSRHVRPRLPTHNTAPTSTRFVRAREGVTKMYHTFDGVVDAPGDTQPDSQMFRQFTSGIMDSNSNIMPTAKPMPADAGEHSADPPSDNFEVVGSSQSQGSPTITSPTVLNDDPETQFRVSELPTSPLKFETPAIAGRKRNSQGHMLSSAFKTNTTPGTVLSASAFFGFDNAVNPDAMSLTQAFNATQAKTSPIVDAPSEDPVFQRPSPNFANTRHSSPGVIVSSPIKATGRNDPATDPVLRSSSEPRADYETMKQSQDRRKRELPGEEPSTLAQDSWDEPTTVEKQFHKRRAKERFDQEAAKSLSVVSAPTPSSRRGRKRGLLSMRTSHRSPRKTTGRTSQDGPNTPGVDYDSPDELSQPIPVTGQSDDDSLDELSQDVTPSARATHAKSSPVKTGKTDNRVQVPNTSSHPPRTLSGQSARKFSQPDTPSQPQRESQVRLRASQPLQKGIARLRSSRESERVMDSQPDPAGELESQPPKPLRFPSSPSTNQYSINQTTMIGRTGFTSQVPSSSVPMPPRSSSQEVPEMSGKDHLLGATEERVPSSPPLIAQPDEVTYDEHAYDEHSGDEHGPDGARSNHEDVQMDDDDGLPVAKDNLAKESNLNEDVRQPQVSDARPHSDDEVPETMDQDEPTDLHNEEEDLIRSSHSEDELNDVDEPMAPPRMKRQSTVPETDMLDETQPSFFPETESESQRESHKESTTDGNAPLIQTGSTDLFHSAKEQQSASQAEKHIDSTAKEGVTPQSSGRSKVRSLLDIANQPGSQRSADLDTIDIPQLSFVTDPSEGINEMMSGSSPVRPTKRRKVTYSAKKKGFRSPGKGPDHQFELGWTPPSVATQEREEEGAQAAACARDDESSIQPAALKSRAPLKTRPETPRKGALKPVNKTILTKSPGRMPPKYLQKASTAVAEGSPSAEAVEANIDDAHEADELAPTTEANWNDYQVFTATDDGEPPTGELLVPNRIFAYWPGRNYYPATCLGRADVRHFRVRYDDGNIHTLDGSQIRALDLRQGDQVKVDMPGLKKHVYVVVGFSNRIVIDDSTGEHPHTDQHGYSTIILEEKARESLPAANQDQPRKRIEAPLRSVYLTTNLWARLRDRYFKYTPPATPGGSTSRPGTPATSDAGLPTSTFPRRSTAGPSLLRDSTARAASVASSVRSGGNVFYNMAFAISFTNESSDKDSITKLIRSNGGQVLDLGFHELFDVDSTNEPVSSEGTAKVVSGLDGLLLERDYKDLGFVALISDSHSRRTKHVEALALNIPILHLRWVHDCLAASRPLPFTKYLLPAGLSTFLDPEGVVRSRSMNTYDPAGEDATFMQMLKQRELLLHGQSVLLVTGKAKKDVERKQPYIFLTQALGPQDVNQCADLAAAKELVKDGSWDLVHVDGGPDALAEAAAFLFGKGKAPSSFAKAKSGSRKRKRDDSVEAEVLVRSGMQGGKKVKVACDEFIIQSLILGALIDE